MTNRQNQYYDVIIIGAGASGLMCGAAAAKRGRSVLILEGNDSPGQKIRISGGGKCNFGNLNLTPENYISNNPHFCKSALHRFNQWDFLEMIKTANIPYHEREHGQLFCDNDAGDILRLLIGMNQKFGGRILTGCHIGPVRYFSNTANYFIKNKFRKFYRALAGNRQRRAFFS